jgi:hypothetical protein
MHDGISYLLRCCFPNAVHGGVEFLTFSRHLFVMIQ